MLTREQIQQHFDEMESFLLNPQNQHEVELSRDWATKTFPQLSGVYALFEGSVMVYVGESGNIRKRMKDLLDTRHHAVRRNIGKTNFGKLPGFIEASSYQKFPEHIEERVESWIIEKIKISVLPIEIGRIEFEERMIGKIPRPKYNIKEKRK